MTSDQPQIVPANPQPTPPRDGADLVARAAALAAVADRPVAEHAAEYEQLHQTLLAALSDIDRA